jgi:hypothetical protein
MLGTAREMRKVSIFQELTVWLEDTGKTPKKV